MAKQSINVSTANSGLGDPLRTAFVKINSNFTELYAALGLDAGGLNLGAFQFSGSVMSTTDSTPMVLNQAVSVTGDLTVGGDLLPNNNLQVNLGSPSKKWHSLYVGTGSVYIGDAKLSLEGGTLNSSVGFSTDSLIIGGNVLTVNESGVLQSTGGINGGAGGGATDRLVNGSHTVALGSDGSIEFPSQLTNNRTGTADALVFKKNNNQKSIATQTGTEAAHDVERLVIAGGDSYFDGTNWLGEGGDLYLWAGRGRNGGDIKVDAGNSLVANQEGGTIKIRGGHAEAGGVGGGILIEAGSSITENGEVNISGQALNIETRNAVRDNYNSWTFDSDGVLRGPDNHLTIDGYIQAKYGNSAGIAGATVDRGTSTVVFSNADGTPRTVYTVDGNTFYLYGAENPATYQVTVYIPGQGQYSPISVTRDTETNVFTFTFYSDLILQGTSSYLVDWIYPDLNGVEIDAGNSYWWFDPDGKIYMPQGGEFGEESWTTPIASVSFGTTTVITLTANEFGMATTGQVIIQGVPGGHPLNDTWYFQAVDVNAIQLYAFEDYSIPIDSTGWTAWSGGGTVRLAKEVVLSTNNHKWRFGYDGSTNFPNGKQVKFSEEIDAYIQAGSATPFLTDGLNLVGGEAGVAVVAIDNSDPANAQGRTWQFKKTGDLELPAFVPGQSGGAQFDAVQGQNVTAGAPPTVVFTSTSGNVESIKALITVISTGAPTGNGPTVTIDTQICEMLITTRYQSYDGGSNVKTAVATVYGVTHTSDVPLATFTVNLIQNFGAGSPYGMRDVIQILAEPTAAVVTLMSVKTVATEILNYF